jgi:putative endonuclease
MDKECFFYMVRCKDDSIYSGIAFDVQERQKKHNNGTGARYTAVHRPVVLILWERHNSLSAAMKREAQVKRFSKEKKEQLAYRFFDMDVKVQQYFDTQPSPQREICLKLRQIILQTFPDTKEVWKRGVPAYSEGKVFIRTVKNQVLLGFSVTGMQANQSALFPGTGKTMRILQFKALADIDEKKIVKLLKMTAGCSGSN